MKKRIFSMILVVVMLVASLASCAYNYEKDDMSNYVTFDQEAFKAAIQGLKIEDATFGHDETERQKKVVDAIINSLAGLADTSAKVTEGKIGANDILYYCYYATGVDKDDKAFTAYAASMKESAAVKLQLGISTTKDLAAKIEAAIKDFDLKDAYKTETGSTVSVSAGDRVYVTYTVTDKEGVETTYTNALVKAEPLTGAPAEGSTVNTAASFEEYLVGMKVATKVAADKKFDGDTNTYSDVTVNWIVKQGTAVEITDYKPEAKTEVEVVGSTTKVDLKEAKELTYHVYPVYAIDVVEYNSEAYTATLILKDILGTALSAGEIAEDGTVTDGTLALFTDNGYKNGEETMNAIVKELVTRITAFSDAETKYDNAVKSYDDAVSALNKNDTPENQEAKATAETAKTNAKTEMDTKEGEVDAQITKLLGCTKEGAASAEDAVKADYSKYRYNSLETSYKSSVTQSIAAAIHAAAVSAITYNTLPEKAVKEAYKSLMNDYKYDFYEGTASSSSSSSSSSSTSVSNYKYYSGDFNAYLRANVEGLTETSSKDDIKAAVMAEAEVVVKDIIVIYVLKDACESIFDTDLEVTDDDVDEFKQSINYILLQYYTGKNKIDEKYYMHTLQFDKVLDYLTEIDEDAATDANNKKIVYKHVAYDFK